MNFQDMSGRQIQTNILQLIHTGKVKMYRIQLWLLLLTFVLQLLTVLDLNLTHLSLY